MYIIAALALIAASKRNRNGLYGSVAKSSEAMADQQYTSTNKTFIMIFYHLPAARCSWWAAYLFSGVSPASHAGLTSSAAAISLMRSSGIRLPPVAYR